MLTLGLGHLEEVVVDSKCECGCTTRTVVSLQRGSNIRLGFEAPKNVNIVRAELLESRRKKDGK